MCILQLWVSECSLLILLLSQGTGKPPGTVSSFQVNLTQQPLCDDCNDVCHEMHTGSWVYTEQQVAVKWWIHIFECHNPCKMTHFTLRVTRGLNQLVWLHAPLSSFHKSSAHAAWSWTYCRIWIWRRCSALFSIFHYKLRHLGSCV